MCVSSILLHFITQKDIVKFTLQVSEIREHDLIQHYIMSHELMIKCNMHNISVHIYHHIKIPCFERLSIPVTDLFQQFTKNNS